MRWSRRGHRVAIILLILIAVASVITAPRKSGKAQSSLLSGAQIEPQLLAVFRRSCQDCHSDTTRYPWYSYVAPVSLLISHDVAEGREHLNLSRWSEYPLVRRTRSLSEIANQVRDGEMPLGTYTFLHRDARLSESDVNAIFQWTQRERARLIAENVK